MSTAYVRAFAVFAGVTVALVVTSFLTPTAHAQTTGTIYGRVLDPSGAVVAGAMVSVTNVETNLERTVTTESDGTYSFTLLPTGTYQINVRAAGFQPYQQTGLVLDVASNLRADLNMKVGEVSAQVSVHGTTPQVDTASATVGKVMDETRIEDLPLNGRNFMQLAVLQPGVVPPVPGISSQGAGTTNTPGGTSVNFEVNGARLTSNNYLLDGVNNTEPYTGGAMIVPSIDAIQEFRILTNMYAAEYGRGGGSIVTILTKSGTNAFHGSAYDFLRNDVFDARNFFAPTVPPLKQNQFGGTLGGPIVKNRTFFFASYEGFRQHAGEPISTPVPTLAARSGDFSHEAVKPIDPQNGKPFPNNMIPSGRWDSVGVNLLNLYPKPNEGTNIWTGTPPLLNDRDQVEARIDHQLIPSKNTLSGRYIYDTGKYNQPGGSSILNLGIVNVPGFGIQSPNTFQNVEIGDTHIFSPSLLNEFRFSYQHSDITNLLPTNHTDPKTLGFTYPIDSSILAPPGVALPGYSALGYNFFNTYQLTLLDIPDNVTLIRGKHNLKFGGDVRHTHVAGNFASIVFGSFAFTGAVTGNPVADLLLGKPLELLQAGGKSNKEVAQTTYALYGQDDYRVTSNLTLNLGLRWEVSPGYTDPQNLEMTFIPGVHSVQSPTLPLGLLRPADPGVPSTIFNTSYTHFAPRIGIAWDPTGKGNTSIRAGYGIFYDDSSLLQIALVQMPPDFQPINVTILPKSLADPYLGKSPYTPPITFPLKFAPGFTATWVDRAFKIPYIQQWNLSVQRQLTSTLALEVAYIGNKGTKLQGTIDPNQAVWMPGATRGNVQSRRPYPAIGNVLQISSRFDSNYNGLQGTLTKRLGNGLSFQAGYTYSKAIDNTTLPTGFYTIPGQQTRPQLSTDLAAERGSSAFDLRHRFVLSYVYELPFYRNSGSRVAQEFLGGWLFNGIFSAQTGRPFTVYDSADPNAGTLVDNTRPNVLRNPNLPNDQRSVLRWFDTAAFQRITPGTWGDERRNILRTGGVTAFDLGLAKQFNVVRENKLEFRWEVFNVLNHSNFGVPVNDFNSPTFGRVLSTTVPERQMQFALKYLF
jgi:outer membrane receptor protein involved in Fe transport